MDNRTAQFLGKDYQWSYTKIFLDDVQSLTGGIQLQIRGSAYSEITIIQPKRRNRRYRCCLKKEKINALLNVLIEQDFCAIRPDQSTEIPQENSIKITVINANQERHVIFKEIGEQAEKFDQIYAALMETVKPVDAWKFIPSELPFWLTIARLLPLIFLVLVTPFLIHKFVISFYGSMGSQDPVSFMPILLGLVGLLLGLILANIFFEWLTMRHTDVFSRPISLMILGLCGFSFLGFIYGAMVVFQTSFVHWGTPTIAQVSEKFIHYNYDSNSGIVDTNYFLRYHYQIDSGEDFSGESMVKRSFYDHTQVGDRLTVYYLPMVPRWSVLEAQQSALSRIPFVLKMLCTLIAWFLELLILTYIIYPLWQWLKPQPRALELPERS
ncbi:MAG: DUF3592 domain-containing protein [Synechococcus sp.]|nr:DUF3592 domain-containing protein [Synechococcus sp.]